jgi:acyl-CoA hydrolase
MPTAVTPDEAVDRLRAIDTVGTGLAVGQPSAFLEALGRRDDWVDLRIYGALFVVPSAVFRHPNVHTLSAFWGPIERGLREKGLNIGFVPTDFRGASPLMAAFAPRVMAVPAAPPDAEGWCSLSLYAGAGLDEIARAAADPERLLVVEVSEHSPRTLGWGDYRHALHVDDIDVLVDSDAKPFVFPDPVPTDVDRAIAELARGYVEDGATLQTGIGSVPSTIAALIAEGDGGDYGIHSEMFTTGLMALHQAGKVTNRRKGQYEGVSVCTFAGGTAPLYRWLDGNEDVRFLPVEVVNSPAVIGKNHNMITINAALAVDIHGQAVADTISGDQYSGIGGHEDFVSGAALSLETRSLLCLPSTVTVRGEQRSRILPYFPAGTVITTPRHQTDVVITEYGSAELRNKTVRQRGEALAAIAHPDFRDELREAALRASRGRSPYQPDFRTELRQAVFQP